MKVNLRLFQRNGIWGIELNRGNKISFGIRDYEIAKKRYKEIAIRHLELLIEKLNDESTELPINKLDPYVPKIKSFIQGKVYFAQAGDKGLIKIGYSTNHIDRIKTLTTGVPEQINIIAVMRGTQKKEKQLHKQFGHLRRRGEWFEPAPELLRFIDEINIIEQAP